MFKNLIAPTCICAGDGVNNPCYNESDSDSALSISVVLRNEPMPEIGPPHYNTRSSLKNSAGVFLPALVSKGSIRSGPVGNAPTPRAGCRKRSQRTAGGLKTGLLKEHPCLFLATVQRVRMRPLAAIRPGASSGKVLPTGGKKTLGSSHFRLGASQGKNSKEGLSCPLAEPFPVRGFSEKESK